MKSDFLLAITQLSAEKKLPKEVVLSAVEAALVSAYRKDSFAPQQEVRAKINPNTGKVTVWISKEVVEKPTDDSLEISLDEAHRINPEAQIGELVEIEATPHNAGRIAAQTAKQVILQRLHEAEHSAIFEEYTGKESEIISGVVQRIEPKQILVDLGRAEAVLPGSEQASTERYRIGQRLKVLLVEVGRGTKGPRLLVSRSHPDLLRRLFESEVPEVFSGTVEIRGISREAGFRSKVAVAASQEGVDPVGSCVGLRGIRIQNIVNELNGEKIDIVQWDPDMPKYITNALSPSQVLRVKLNEEEGLATVVVPDKQLSLAIGREGQNVRLAAKLTGWRIDIKSASDAEAEAKMKPEAEVKAEPEEEALVTEEAVTEIPEVFEEALMPVETIEEITEEAEPLPALDVESLISPIPLEPAVTEEKARVRFAEDILGPRQPKPESKMKKKKKKVRETAEDGVKLRKRHRQVDIPLDEEDDEF
ncbi:transcription termination factor NusA [Chloroflexota bacterium]